MHRPKRTTLTFFDFCSVTQRPRTPEQDVAFGKALEAMPSIYLEVDAVIHIDIELSDVPGDGEMVEAAAAGLRDAQLLQLGDEVQILAVPEVAGPASTLRCDW